MALCQATSPCGTFHHLTPAAPFWSSHPQRGRTQATGRGQSEHPREDVHPEEDNEEEFWVYTGDDDDVSSYEDLDEPDDVSVERSHSSERGRGGPGWGNDDRTQRTRGREDSEDSLSEEREYTEADLTAVDKEYEELLRAVQQRQERGADWEGAITKAFLLLITFPKRLSMLRNV